MSPTSGRSTFSGRQTWHVYIGALSLTADPLSQFSTINTVGNPLDLIAARTGTYDLTGKPSTATRTLEREPDERECNADCRIAGYGSHQRPDDEIFYL